MDKRQFKTARGRFEYCSDYRWIDNDDKSIPGKEVRGIVKSNGVMYIAFADKTYTTGHKDEMWLNRHRASNLPVYPFWGLTYQAVGVSVYSDPVRVTTKLGALLDVKPEKWQEVFDYACEHNINLY